MMFSQSSRLFAVALLCCICVAAAIDDVDNDGNACFSDGDNFDADPGNTGRGDWGKCLPVPLYDVFGHKAARKLYTKLKALHTRFCTHIDVLMSEELEDEFSKWVLKTAPYSDDSVYKAFRKSFMKSVNQFLQSYRASKLPLESRCGLGSDDEDADEQQYVLHALELTFDEVNGVTADHSWFSHEDSDHAYTAETVSMCSETGGYDGETPQQSEGGFCIWTLKDVGVLPDDQQGGFDNADWQDDLSFPVMRSLVDSRYSNENDKVLFRKNRKNFAKHCHYTPSATGMLRVYSFQHDLERKYPGKIHKVCFCDWHHMAQLVQSCDCTLDGSANNGCGDEQSAALEELGIACSNC